MSIEQVREALTTAGVNAIAIALLQKEDMLDTVALNAASADQLKTIGLTLGMAMKVKSAFKGEQVAAAIPVQAVAAPASPVLVVKKQGKKTAGDILAALATPTPETIDDARKHFKNEKVFVTNSDGSLDVPATSDYLGWKTRAGTSERFKNTAGQSVQLVNLDGLLNVILDLDPLTGQVLVPGDPMLALNRDQRLLVAFAVVTRRTTSDQNADLIIEQVQRTPLPGSWAQAAVDLESARRNQTDAFRQAEQRLSKRAR